MRSVLAILRKDVRHLRPQLLAWLALAAVSCVVEPLRDYWPDSNGFRISSLALLACAFLIAALIHEEPLAGDRQYWLTRPFTPRELLAAKALFLLLLVVIPALLAQMTSLAILGIPPGDYAGALLWRMVFFVAAIVLPVASLAAVTRNLMHFLLAALLATAAIFLLALLFHDVFPTWSGPAWAGAVAGYIALLVSGTVVLSLQYAQRATNAGRVLLGAMVLAFFIASLTETDTVSATVRITAEPPPAHIARPLAADVIAIPIRIPGTPSKAEALGATVHLTVSGKPVEGAVIRDFSGGTARLVLTRVPERMDARVSMSGWANLTLFERVREFRRPGADSDIYVAGVGVCTTRRFEPGPSTVTCLTPTPRRGLAWNGALRWIIPPGLDAGAVDFTRPLQPVVRFSANASVGTEVDGQTRPGAMADIMVVVRTISTLRGEFFFKDIRPADYRAAE